jgi:hypothetical protein
VTRIRLILMSLLAALAVAAVASASASAHRYVSNSCTTASGTGTKYKTESECLKGENPGSGGWERVEIANGTKVTGTIGVSKLVGKITGVAITIECKKGKSTGDIGTGGSSHAVLTYEECKIVGTLGEKCKVPTTLKTTKLKDLLTASGRVEDTFEPETTGGNFIELVVSAVEGKTCTPAATYPVTGSQVCEVDSSDTVAKTLQASHELICKTSGSHLVLGGNAATYEGTATVKLESGLNWATD